MEADGGDGYVHSDCGDGVPSSYMCQKEHTMLYFKYSFYISTISHYIC